jgi:3-hydroxy-3-methylglutaryl CoA synthase
MTIGVAGYAVYVPRYRLKRATILAAWGASAWANSPAPGSKAVMNYDEDALTMGQAAAWPLHSMDPDTVYFASTTAPYWQRSAASLIAACCDLPAKVAAADFGASLRCGAAALRSAFDAVTAGSGKTALVVASDARVGAPESGEEMVFGDAAAASAVSGDRVIAELIASSSRSDDFMDEWRRDTDTYVRSFPSKYSATRGYEENVVTVQGGWTN